jgi:hypothetical protein
MPNFAQTIILLISGAGAGWTETTPALADVKFPWKVSKDFFTSPARRGPYKNMIWAAPQDVAGRDTDDEYGTYKRLRVNVYCYSRAVSDLEDDSKNGEIRVSNMRDQVSKLIIANRTGLTGAVRMENPVDLRPLDDPNGNPAIYCRVLQVEVLYVEAT